MTNINIMKHLSFKKPNSTKAFHFIEQISTRKRMIFKIQDKEIRVYQMMNRLTLRTFIFRDQMKKKEKNKMGKKRRDLHVCLKIKLGTEFIVNYKSHSMKFLDQVHILIWRNKNLNRRINLNQTKKMKINIEN